MFLSILYLVAAVIGGTILVCQFALAILGLGHGGTDFGDHVGGGFHGGDFHGDHFDVHADHPGDAHGEGDQHADSTHLFAVVSFRTLVAASAFFGVTGLATWNAGFPATTTLVLATVAGCLPCTGCTGYCD